MRSWKWGGALAAATAVGLSGSVAPLRPTELAIEPATPPRPCGSAAPACCPAVTDALDLVAALRPGGPTTDEPPLAPRSDAPGDIIPAVFLLPAEPDEEAPMPRVALELAPMPRVVADDRGLSLEKLTWTYSCP